MNEDSGDDQETLQSIDGFRKRKITQNRHHDGSFFLRAGAIGFGLVTMIYCGFLLGEAIMQPFPECFDITVTLYPILLMLFSFFQMYFIFANARVSVHRYKGFARFVLMHIIATDICIWIRGGVTQHMNDVKIYNEQMEMFNTTQLINNTPYSVVHQLWNEYQELGLDEDKNRQMRGLVIPKVFENPSNFSSDMPKTIAMLHKTTTTKATTSKPISTKSIKSYMEHFTTRKPIPYLRDTKTTATTSSSIRSTLKPISIFNFPTMIPTTTPAATITTTKSKSSVAADITTATTTTTTASTTATTTAKIFTPLKAITSHPLLNIFNDKSDGQPPKGSEVAFLVSNKLYVEPPQAWTLQLFPTKESQSNCSVIIPKRIVQTVTPFLYPCVVSFCLIGAAVSFIIWRHTGDALSFLSDDNISTKLANMCSQRVMMMKYAENEGNPDCAGSSKGLFCGLLLSIATAIALILFFVLGPHPQFTILSAYLAEGSLTAITAACIFSTLIGFIRARNLQYFPTHRSDLNDILLRVSAFGFFVYALFSIIAGASYATKHEQNLLIMITWIVSILQVVLQLLYISDMSKRHVYLPGHERSKPGRQVVTFLIICNITMSLLFFFEIMKVTASPIQLTFYGFIPWKVVQLSTVPLCIFHRFASAVALAEIWKNSYKPRMD